ncbi:MAG TPA: hypothetical protein VFK06_20940 [Candidatus Angelobacter sp.]|nr:hypothetical protein [Candidatus Angelobacter sp.]
MDRASTEMLQIAAANTILGQCQGLDSGRKFSSFLQLNQKALFVEYGKVVFDALHF